MYKQQHLLIIGFVWAEPSSSAVGLRTVNLLHFFKSLGWKITFASAAADSEHEFDLASIGVDKVSIELNNSSFDSFIKKLNPSIVIFDRFVTEEQFGWRVIEQCPEALRILDTIDLHCLRSARQQAVKENREFQLDDLSSDTAKREIASILRSDLSLMISDFEMNILQTHFKIDPKLLFYLPLTIDPITNANWKDYDSREDFMFIGNFIHEPNWDAVLQLKTKIWSGIRKKLPGVNLYIYGAYPSEKVLNLNNPKEGFHIMGRTDSCEAVFGKAKVCLAPIRFGAGVKGKLLDAMLYGTPSVTTNIGAEGMNGNLEWNGIIANNDEEFIQAAVELYSNKNLWETCQANGLEIINHRFSKEHFQNSLMEMITEILENLEAHRKNNFIGSLLLHHTNLSTKYMSKWIEEKNSKNIY